MERSFCIKNSKKAVEPIGENILIAIIPSLIGIMTWLAKAAVPASKHLIGKPGCEVTENSD